MKTSDLIPGAVYSINYPGSTRHEPWKGLAIYEGVDQFAGYLPNSLCFSPLDVYGKPDGSEGVFDIEHVSPLGQHQGALNDQLIELRRIATKLKLYDGADRITALLEDVPQPLAYWVRQLLADLPAKRDWLNPDVEHNLRELTK